LRCLVIQSREPFVFTKKRKINSRFFLGRDGWFTIFFGA